MGEKSWGEKTMEGSFLSKLQVSTPWNILKSLQYVHINRKKENGQ